MKTPHKQIVSLQVTTIKPETSLISWSVLILWPFPARRSWWLPSFGKFHVKSVCSVLLQYGMFVFCSNLWANRKHQPKIPFKNQNNQERHLNLVLIITRTSIVKSVCMYVCVYSHRGWGPDWPGRRGRVRTCVSVGGIQWPEPAPGSLDCPASQHRPANTSSSLHTHPHPHLHTTQITTYIRTQAFTYVKFLVTSLQYPGESMYWQMGQSPTNCFWKVQY